MEAPGLEIGVGWEGEEREKERELGHDASQTNEKERDRESSWDRRNLSGISHLGIGKTRYRPFRTYEDAQTQVSEEKQKEKAQKENDTRVLDP